QPLGNFVLRWARKERWPCAIPAELMLNESAFQLPSIPVAPSLVIVELHLPEVCYSRGAFMARYRIYNCLDVDMTVEIGMGLSDCFMVSGNKLVIRSCLCVFFGGQSTVCHLSAHCLLLLDQSLHQSK